MSSYAFWTAIAQGLLSGILCLGVYVAFRVVRFPDLSCDGTYPLGACVATVLILHGLNPLLATLVAAMCGAVAGSITGFLNARLRIPAIVSSILVMSGLYSVNLVIMGSPILSLSKTSTVFSQVENFISKNAIFLESWKLKNVVYPILFLFLVFLVKKCMDWFLGTETGLTFRTSGDNPKMARIMAINTQAMVIVGLAMANGLIALAGALYAQMQKFADVNLGIGMIIVGLASVFIGEAIENQFFKTKRLFITTFCVILGSLVYKLAIAIAYEIGLKTDYFNLLTSGIVAVALLTPSIRSDILSTVRRD